MMAVSKRRRENPSTPEWTFPTDLLLEIVARSDTRALVRCAAACRLLRCDILSQPFIRRVTQQGGIVPPWVVACCHNTHDEKDDPPTTPLSLVHPATSTAESFLNDHLSPYISRFMGDLLGEHYPVTSRGGLVLLRRRHVSDGLPSLCVYDPITGHRTFLSDPPDIGSNLAECFDRCVLLTSADGIGCSFSLFVPYRSTLDDGTPRLKSTVKVQTATSTCGTWAPAVTSDGYSCYGLHWREIHRDTVVLQGGVIHWLQRHRGDIVSYNVCTTEMERIELPGSVIGSKGRLHLGPYYSHQGKKLLRLMAACKFTISVWHQLPGGDWAPEAVLIHTEEKLRSMYPDIPPGRPVRIEFKCSGEESNIVLLRVSICSPNLQTSSRTLRVILDLETKEMHEQHYSTSSSSVLLEVDLPSRLRAMKVFT